MESEVRTLKYRQRGEAPNAKCPCCGVLIWHQRGVYTTYHGKPHMWNDMDLGPCSFDVLDHENLEGPLMTVCPACYKRNYTHGEDGDVRH